LTSKLKFPETICLPDPVRIRRVTESIIGLPTLPTVVSKMIDIADSPRSSAVVLSRLIAADQSLTAKILKLSNSAYYGFSRKISTVNQAIVVLGFNTVKEMGLSLSVFDVFRKTPSSGGFDVRLFWEHSVGCGVSTRLLARKCCPSLAGEAFVAGLLHDVGKVILKQYFDREFAQIIEIQKERGISLEAAEQEILGTTHGQIGAWLAEKWNLPKLITASILHHHDPWEADGISNFIACVLLGDYLCHAAGSGNSGRIVGPVIDAKVWDIFAEHGIAFDESELDDFKNEFVLAFDKAGSYLSLE